MFLHTQMMNQAVVIISQCNRHSKIALYA